MATSLTDDRYTGTQHAYDDVLDLLDLASIIEDIFMVLTDKEKEIIIRRFNLHNKGKETLESIGKKFVVTRERVRQIEEGALKKLRRTYTNTQLEAVVELAKRILDEHGGIKSEDRLIAQLLKFTAGNEKDIDRYIIKLALHIDPDIIPLRLKKADELYDTWRLDHVSEKQVRLALDMLYDVLHKEEDILHHKELIKRTQKRLTFDAQHNFLQSLLNISQHFKHTDRGVGLRKWRHINPKSIKDKAYIIFKRHGKPMHFVELANAIIEYSFDKKVVTTQAVHNELIRNPIFVLVGRGLYALREWGYNDGTVGDVIAGILREKGQPMSKSEIVEEVLKIRDVKPGTISLNLQKNPHFARVGRAVYCHVDHIDDYTG